MNVKYFHKCGSSSDLEKMYKEVYDLFGLASRPKDHHLRKDVDLEFKHLLESFQAREKEKEYSFEEYTLDEILEQIHFLKLKGEICGKWLWLNDQGAFKHKDQLQHLGFRYAKNKKSWYWRPDEFKCDNQDPMPMDYIREKYGSETISIGS
jgi:hypothetical protein